MCSVKEIDPRREFLYRMGVLAIVAMLVLHLSSLLFPLPSRSDVHSSVAGLRRTLGDRFAAEQTMQVRGWPMDLAFTRSGGFAGAATEVKGIMSFTTEGAEVTAPGNGYHRALTADEAAKVKNLVEGALQHTASSGDSATRDAFQYSVTVTQTDGKARDLLLSSADNVAVPLLTWVQAETQRIWDFKLAHRPST